MHSLVFNLFLCVALPHFSLIVDPFYLDLLHADSTADLAVPAVVCFDDISDDCLLGFRGATSLLCDKKSWDIEPLHPELFTGENHIFLNAQFRDPSLIRNTLGLLVTRKLGFPAPKTEFVSLSINGLNMGVYEHIERIDRLFYQRNSLPFGPLFKGVDVMARIALHYSDTTAIAGFEPKIDSKPYINTLSALIEDCFRGDVSSLETNELLAAFAVNAAICDNDGLLKNFYLHKADDVWHYYPWDRDATFGNSWQGQYDSTWITKTNLADMGYFGATSAILSDPQNMLRYNSYVEQIRDVFSAELPFVIDSLRLLLRDELSLDPFYLYSPPQFDSLCAVLSQDISLRADFLPSLLLSDQVAQISDYSISSPLDMQSSVSVELTTSGGNPSGVICLAAYDGFSEEFHWMTNTAGNRWSIELQIPPDTYCLHLAFAPYGLHDQLPLFFPPWGIRTYDVKPDPALAARVALAGLHPDFLAPSDPLWCGENLWVLPIKNTSSETQDISLCRFSLGQPSGNIFFPESTLIAPGQTFYLTNSLYDATSLFPGFDVFGDAGTSYPGGSTLVFYDPAWKPISSWQLVAGDSLPLFSGNLIPCEISAGLQNDWIELVNYSADSVDLSNWYFMDSDYNCSCFPDSTVLPGFSLLLAVQNPILSEPFGSGKIIPLDFSLKTSQESLSLYTNLGDPVFSFEWDDSWPICDTGIMSLKAPVLPFFLSQSWEPAPRPGTPGRLNPGWLNVQSPSLTLLSENPCDGTFCFSYQTFSFPAQAVLYDISGRVVSEIELPDDYCGTVHADFSSLLPSGVYLLYIRSSAGHASTGLTVLH